MLKPRKKVCKGCLERTYIWSGGYCKICDAKRRRIKDDLPFSGGEIPPDRRSSLYGLPARSEKRLLQEKVYEKVKREVRREQRLCHFCNEPVARGDIHHLMGRDGELLHNKQYLVHVHRRCHRQYHDKSAHDIPWYGDWLWRLKKQHPSLYTKELMKLDKL